MIIEQIPREAGDVGLGSLQPRTGASYERELRRHRSIEAWLRESIAEGELLLGLKDSLLQQQEAMIRQQKLLAREADHRLLNDLQIVVSLLSLQSRRTSNAEASSLLATAANRVATIERLHRRLHCLDGAQIVAFKPYLEDLCGDFSTMLSSALRAEQMIAVESIEIDLPAATAAPLGFIVSELLTNAVKHGQGGIAVRLERKSPEGYALSVSNDGEALPETFDPGASRGLGMKIVQSFIGQIGGRLQIGRNERNQGARFEVLFCLVLPSKPVPLA